MMELGIYRGKNGQCIILNKSMRITTPKIYGMLSPVQTWDIEVYDVLDAIPINTIRRYLDGKLETALENDYEHAPYYVDPVYRSDNANLDATIKLMMSEAHITQEQVDTITENDPIQRFFKVAKMCGYVLCMNGQNRKPIWLIPDDFYKE